MDSMSLMSREVHHNGSLHMESLLQRELKDELSQYLSQMHSNAQIHAP